MMAAVGSVTVDMAIVIAIVVLEELRKVTQVQVPIATEQQVAA